MVVVGGGCGDATGGVPSKYVAATVGGGSRDGGGGSGDGGGGSVEAWRRGRVKSN